jgi:hypothetical protein
LLPPYLTARGGDLKIDLPHCHFVKPLAPRLGPDCFEERRSRGDRVDEIPDAHDNDLGLASLINNEAFPVFPGPFHYLAELSPGSQGGYDIWHRFLGRLLNDEPPELINQFSFSIASEGDLSNLGQTFQVFG